MITTNNWVIEVWPTERSGAQTKCYYQSPTIIPLTSHMRSARPTCIILDLTVALLELTTISMPELWQLLCGDLHSLLQLLQILYFLSSHSKGKKFNKGKDHCAWNSRRWPSKSNNICFFPVCFRQSSQQSWCERMSSASVKARYPNA